MLIKPGDVYGKLTLKKCLDFRVSRTRAKGGIKAVEYIDVRQFKDKVKPDAKEVTFKDSHGLQRTVSFLYQKTGYGKKRFFCCPFCLKRVQKLYFVGNEYICSECGKVNPYKGIRNDTKGGYGEIAYRMKRYAARYNIQFEFPFDYSYFALDKRVRKKSFVKCLMVLQALENMRFCSLIFKTTYKATVIRSVIMMKHPIQRSATLEDLKNNMYDWNTGKQIVMNETMLRQITH